MLNACPKCQRTFPEEDGRFCPVDGETLSPIDGVTVAADPTDPVIASTIAGRYEIRRKIADGGMGRVYEARDKTDQRRVAVKILHPDIAEDEVNIERFRREAETSSQLDHGHIVDVFDFASVPQLPGRPGTTWYLAMEYLDGEELRTLINRDKLIPLPRIIRMMSQLALGLDPAHKRGLVHRDMKPDNVFLVRKPDGDLVKVLDFGSVKFTRGQDKNNKLTVMGTTIGSPYYMSPEQAQGAADLDHRADVWALGVIVYEMTVGRVPFYGPNGPQILFKILGDEALPPTMVKHDVAPELDDVLLKVLQKKPAARYATVGDFADALGHAFGLRDSHREWSNVPESELAARLEKKTAPVTVAAPVVATVASAKPPVVEHAAAAKSYPSEDSVQTSLDELPVQKLPSWAIPVGFVAGLLVVGAVVAMVFR